MFMQFKGIFQKGKTKWIVSLLSKKMNRQVVDIVNALSFYTDPYTRLL